MAIPRFPPEPGNTVACPHCRSATYTVRVDPEPDRVVRGLYWCTGTAGRTERPPCGIFLVDASGKQLGGLLLPAWRQEPKADPGKKVYRYDATALRHREEIIDLECVQDSRGHRVLRTIMAKEEMPIR